VPTSSPAPGKDGARSHGCGLWFVIVVLGLLMVAGFITYHFANQKSPAAAGCTVRGDGPDLELEPDQAANAATIAAVATSRGLPERALTIALATSMQESRLSNLDFGDRDSLGLFQQRPSQGWGTAKEIQDPVYSTNAFFDHLVKIRGYTQLPVTVAAQRVQRSGYPEAYAQHEADATLLSAALSGHDQGALSCTTGGDSPDSAGGPLGRTSAVTALLTREFGSQVRPRTDPAPHTVAVPSVPAGGGSTRADGARRGWELAQWAVAHAHDLKVEQVSFGDMRWEAARSDKGWQKQRPASSSGAGKGASTVAATSADGFVRITVAQ
jgi:hypothetical protein